MTMFHTDPWRYTMCLTQFLVGFFWVKTEQVVTHRTRFWKYVIICFPSNVQNDVRNIGHATSPLRPEPHEKWCDYVGQWVVEQHSQCCEHWHIFNCLKLVRSLYAWQPQRPIEVVGRGCSHTSPCFHSNFRFENQIRQEMMYWHLSETHPQSPLIEMGYLRFSWEISLVV